MISRLALVVADAAVAPGPFVDAVRAASARRRWSDAANGRLKPPPVRQCTCAHVVGLSQWIEHGCGVHDSARTDRRIAARAIDAMIGGAS